MKIKFNDWVKEWAKVYKKPYVKNTTYNAILINIRLHIPLFILNKDIAKINFYDIQTALNDINSSRIRKDLFDIYNGSFRVACNLGYIPKNPCDMVIKPKHIRKRGSALNTNELNEFIELIKGHRLEKYFLFCIYTGCRRSEALNIKWVDVDFNNKAIRVRGTKTALSDRIIPLLPDCEKLLLSMPNNKDKIFHHRPDYVSKSFKKLCPSHKLHDLRHTFATQCLKCGVSLKTASFWLGHSSVNITANIYMHVHTEFLFKEAEKIKF